LDLDLRPRPIDIDVCCFEALVPAVRWYFRSGRRRRNSTAGFHRRYRSALAIAATDTERSQGGHADAYSEQHREESNPQLASQTRSGSQIAEFGMNVMVRTHSIFSGNRETLHRRNGSGAVFSLKERLARLLIIFRNLLSEFH
jgi:hypothetical protein